MTSYMLDTNIASHIIKGDIPLIIERLIRIPVHCIVISVVTEAELLYGLAKCGNPKGLEIRIREFLARVTVLPWTSETAQAYSRLRVLCEGAGVTVSTMDMMIAAHAQDKAILVSRDQIFSKISAVCGLSVEDWSKPS